MLGSLDQEPVAGEPAHDAPDEPIEETLEAPARIGRAPDAVTNGVATVSIGCLSAQAGLVTMMLPTERVSVATLRTGKAANGMKWRRGGSGRP